MLMYMMMNDNDKTKTSDPQPAPRFRNGVLLLAEAGTCASQYRHYLPRAAGLWRVLDEGEGHPDTYDLHGVAEDGGSGSPWRTSTNPGPVTGVLLPPTAVLLFPERNILPDHEHRPSTDLFLLSGSAFPKREE